MEDRPYWWCKKCGKNVHVLIAYNIGLYCRECGARVVRPKNIKIDVYDDRYEPLDNELPPISFDND